MRPVQKWNVISFSLQSFVWKSFGISQYAMPNVMNPFQPSAPECTCAMVQSV